ncbi:MAG: maltose alpha-D-glucosyltransferase [Chitinophagales bacterium]|nr:maltose alpha-D-glucosyltransferase [Chitinophagales bacterium]
MPQTDTSKNDPLWYKDAIIYELHIKAFRDANGDGIGDFEGLFEKLDYLEELGVTAIWLLPFYPSPLRDDGYDIANYYDINPSYGTLKDFRRFVREAHRKGMKVITELVLNHTSDQHPWFQRARKAPKNSRYRNYYVWNDDQEKYKDTRIIFTDTETSNWTWDPIAKQYYWHRFFSHQPDLNYDSPDVQQEVFRIIDFWLEMGVDGFRIDAVPYLFEREGTNCENLPETHVFLKKLRKHIDDHFPGTMLLAEANMWPEEAAAYFGEGDECQMNYHFPLMPRMFMSIRMEDRYPITDIFEQTPAIPENCQWAMFLRNHDELTLEMVTDEERDYMYKVYAKDLMARINVGIRHRLAPLLDNNRRKIELMDILLFSMPGTPVIYYGDEIGMGDNFYLGDRDGVRTPMQWNADRNGGFSIANPQKLYLPTILDPEYTYEAVNVETQQKNPSSLLWWVRRVINMRKRFKAFGRGGIQFLSVSNHKVLAFIRSYEDEHILVVANLSRFSQAAELDLKEFKGYITEEIFSQNRFPDIRDEGYWITLGPHGYYWFQLKPEQASLQSEGNLPTLQLDTWDSLANKHQLLRLESRVLPAYLQSVRWFGGKARGIQRIKILETIPFPMKKEQVWWLIMEVTFFDGLPEMYQLPLAFVAGSAMKKFTENHPKSIVSNIQVGNEKGIMVDALYKTDFQKELLYMLAFKKKMRNNGYEIEFSSHSNVKQVLKDHEEKMGIKMLGVEQSNTSLNFGNQFFLKLYRKIDQAINPDVEVTRFLTERAHFPSTPSYLGAISYTSKGQPIMLGMLSELVPNHGDAWEYFKEAIKRYMETIMTDGAESIPANVMEALPPYFEFEKLSPAWQALIGSNQADMVDKLGMRTAEMHIALASKTTEPGFESEPFSLHYQRGLYSAMQSLVRSNFQLLEKTLAKLPETLQEEAKTVLGRKNEVLAIFKNIYQHKITTNKIRIHGDYHLGQVLFTGKDFMIIDFEGEPARAYSERRLKRSPLRDVAGMIRSFHYVAYSALLNNTGAPDPNIRNADKWAEDWYRNISAIFLNAYMEGTQGREFIPREENDTQLLLEIYLLEKAVYELGYELNNRPDWVAIPLRSISYILNKYQNGQESSSI